MDVIKQTKDELNSQIEFLTAKLQEERELLEEESLIEIYDNGGGQKGRHKNPRYEAYESLMNTYLKVVKQYMDMTEGDSQCEITELSDMMNRFKVAK